MLKRILDSAMSFLIYVFNKEFVFNEKWLNFHFLYCLCFMSTAQLQPTFWGAKLHPHTTLLAIVNME